MNKHRVRNFIWALEEGIDSELTELKSLEELLAILIPDDTNRTFEWETRDDKVDFDSFWRHLFAYLNGISKDHESNCNHLVHAACRLLFIADRNLKAESGGGSNRDSQ